MNPANFGSLPADACQLSPDGALGSDRISRVTYDAAGRLVQTESGVGTNLQQVTARYAYSVSGLKTALTDANGNTSAFAYDGFDRLKRLYYPASPRGSGVASSTDYEEYSYDVNGNRTSFRKRDGSIINYSYDALNRITVKDLPGTTTDDAYYAYDDSYRTVTGRLGSSTSSTYYTKTFDVAGQLKGDTGTSTSLGVVTTSRDGDGNLATLGIDSTITSYTYDTADRIVGLGYQVNSTYSVAPEATFGYGTLNHLASISRSNGVTTSFTYDGAGHLTGLVHAGGAGSTGSYQTFSYNAGGQLVGQAQNSSAYVWSGHPTTTTNFTHDQLNRDAAMAAASGYDANGNLISDGVRTFTYDAENRLRSVTGGSTSVTLNYDPWGRLNIVTAGSTTTTFYYFGSSLVADYTPGDTRYYLYGNSDQPLVWVGDPLPKFFHQDRLGSVIAVSDGNGVITPYTYGPYGEPQNWAGSRFRYTGQIAIPEAQLYHYRARVYDPMMGRFLQADPIRYGDGPNIYAYVHGDPVNGTDPSGLWGYAVVRNIDECGGCASHVGIVGSTNGRIYDFSYGPQYSSLVNPGSLVVGGPGGSTSSNDIAQFQHPLVGTSLIRIDATDQDIQTAGVFVNAVVSANPERYSDVPEILGGVNSNSGASAVVAIAEALSGSGNVSVPPTPGGATAPGWGSGTILNNVSVGSAVVQSDGAGSTTVEVVTNGSITVSTVNSSYIPTGSHIPVNTSYTTGSSGSNIIRVGGKSGGGHKYTDK